MFCNEMNYVKGSENRRERVEVGISTENGKHIATCTLDVERLIYGITTYSGSDGREYTFTPKQQLDILTLVAANREQLVNAERVKTYDDWVNSGLSTFQDYCKPGDYVTEDIVDCFMNSVPPVTFTRGMVQAGEPYNFEPDEQGIYRNTYETFTFAATKERAGRSIWKYNGLCFRDQITNRVDPETSLERRINALKSQTLPKD